MDKWDFCLIIERDSASIFIIFENAGDLFFFNPLLGFNARGQNVKKASFCTNKSKKINIFKKLNTRDIQNA